MPIPTFLIGPGLKALGWARAVHQNRRKVRLTVHRAFPVDLVPGQTMPGTVVAQGRTAGPERYYIGITNASKQREITVTHIWFDTEPRCDVFDADLPVRLRYDARWETSIAVSAVPANPDDAAWLARCLLMPNDKVVKSRPRKNVPPIGVIPRG